jgi:superfamily II DNA helicase RecQ
MKCLISEDYPNQCGIIYCITQKNCVELADFFVKCGFSATFYHGGLEEEKRKVRQAKSKFFCVIIVILNVNSFQIF